MKMIYISALTCAQMLPRLSSHRSSSEEACLNSRMPSEMRLSRKGIKQRRERLRLMEQYHLFGLLKQSVFRPLSSSLLSTNERKAFEIISTRATKVEP